MLSNELDDIKNFEKELYGSGGTSDKMAKRMLQGLPGAIKILQSQIEGLKIALADAGITKAIMGMAAAIGVAIDWFQSLSPIFQEIIAMVIAAGPILLGLGTVFNFIFWAIGPMIPLFAALASGIALVGAAIIANPIGAAIMAIIAAVYLVWQYWDEWIAFWRSTFESIQMWLMDNDLFVPIMDGIQTLKNIWSDGVQFLVDSWLAFVNLIFEGAKKITGFFSDLIPDWMKPSADVELNKEENTQINRSPLANFVGKQEQREDETEPEQVTNPITRLLVPQNERTEPEPEQTQRNPIIQLLTPDRDPVVLEQYEQDKEPENPNPVIQLFVPKQEKLEVDPEPERTQRNPVIQLLTPKQDKVPLEQDGTETDPEQTQENQNPIIKLLSPKQEIQKTDPEQPEFNPELDIPKSEKETNPIVKLFAPEQDKPDPETESENEPPGFGGPPGLTFNIPDTQEETTGLTASQAQERTGGYPGAGMQTSQTKTTNIDIGDINVDARGGDSEEIVQNMNRQIRYNIRGGSRGSGFKHRFMMISKNYGIFDSCI